MNSDSLAEPGQYTLSGSFWGDFTNIKFSWRRQTNTKNIIDTAPSLLILVDSSRSKFLLSTSSPFFGDDEPLFARQTAVQRCIKLTDSRILGCHVVIALLFLHFSKGDESHTCQTPPRRDDKTQLIKNRQKPPVVGCFKQFNFRKPSPPSESLSDQHLLVCAHTHTHIRNIKMSKNPLPTSRISI